MARPYNHPFNPARPESHNTFLVYNVNAFQFLQSSSSCYKIHTTCCPEDVQHVQARAKPQDKNCVMVSRPTLDYFHNEMADELQECAQDVDAFKSDGHKVFHQSSADRASATWTAIHGNAKCQLQYWLMDFPDKVDNQIISGNKEVAREYITDVSVNTRDGQDQLEASDVTFQFSHGEVEMISNDTIALSDFQRFRGSKSKKRAAMASAKGGENSNQGGSSGIFGK